MIIKEQILVFLLEWLDPDSTRRDKNRGFVLRLIVCDKSMESVLDSIQLPFFLWLNFLTLMAFGRGVSVCRAVVLRSGFLRSAPAERPFVDGFSINRESESSCNL